MVVKLKPLNWERRGTHLWTCQTIVGCLVVNWLGDSWVYQFPSLPVESCASLEDAKKKAEEWYLEKLKPAFEMLPRNTLDRDDFYSTAENLNC